MTLLGNRSGRSALPLILIIIVTSYFLLPDFKITIDSVLNLNQNSPAPSDGRDDFDNSRVQVTFNNGEQQEECDAISVIVEFDEDRIDFRRLDVNNPSFTEPGPYNGITLGIIPFQSRIYVDFYDEDKGYVDYYFYVDGCYDHKTYHFDPSQGPVLYRKAGYYYNDETEQIEFSLDEYSLASVSLPDSTIYLGDTYSIKEITDLGDLDNTKKLTEDFWDTEEYNSELLFTEPEPRPMSQSGGGSSGGGFIIIT